MGEVFSPATRLWIEKQALLTVAEERFWQEWGQILRGIQRHFAAKGWLSRTYNEPPDIVQLYRPDWPGGEAQVHYEVLCHEEFRQRGIVDFSLHFEDNLPNQKKVCERMRQLIRPHVRSILASGSCSVPDAPLQDILKGSLPLMEVASDKIIAMVEAMAQTESFVDEALFLAGRRKVWRTDFKAGDPEPVIEISWGDGNSEIGGWKYATAGGRFNSQCLELRPGEKHNYSDGMNILMLCGDLLHDFTNGQEIYGSAVVRCPKGIELTLTLQTDKECGWKIAFQETKKFPESDGWQLVTWQGAIEDSGEHDFAEKGVYGYLIADELEETVRIDSMEIGLCK